MLEHEDEPGAIDLIEEQQARSRARRMRFYDGDGEALPEYDLD